MNSWTCKGCSWLGVWAVGFHSGRIGGASVETSNTSVNQSKLVLLGPLICSTGAIRIRVLRSKSRARKGANYFGHRYFSKNNLLLGAAKAISHGELRYRIDHNRCLPILLN
jgi:hypothetical protein